jgi:linoleoyl-CoA desaturase
VRCRLALSLLSLKSPEPIAHHPAESSRKIKFSKADSFHKELKWRVDEYFLTTGKRRRDCPQMYLKVAILLSGFAAAYGLLVFAAQTWWQGLPLAMLLGSIMAGIGMNVQHDGGHQAISDWRWINRLMAMSLELIGGSSYYWHWKHAVLHHTYVNLSGHDTDIDLGILGRLSPNSPRLAFHRWQHFYLWILYGLLAIKWHFYDDYRDLVLGTIGEHRIPRPAGWDLAQFVVGKIGFLKLAMVIPLCFHPIGTVMLFYAITATVAGIVLSVVFQLAHAVGQAEFPVPRADTGCVENEWAIHQVETTVDFARTSPLATWLLGGLNFQIEHHLFPRICHIHYPALSPLVEATCRDFGVTFSEHRTFRSGVAAHYRWLRQMGMPTPTESGDDVHSPA